MTVGQRIAQKRKELGLSQETLGEQLGVSRQAIYKWESDSTLPEIEKLIALSRIFGVSVGWLLGVEEHAPESEPSGELNETQMQMVREIVDGYLTAQPKPELSKKRRTWPLVLVGLVFVFLLWNVYSRMQSISEDYGRLSASIHNISNNVASQIGNITNRVEEILQSQNDLTADYSTEVVSIDETGSLATFSFRVIPKTYQEGMVAWIDVVNEGAHITFGPYEAVREVFSGEFTVALTDSTTIYIVFEHNGVRQTQLLNTYQNLYSGSFPFVYLDVHLTHRAVDNKTNTFAMPLEGAVTGWPGEGDLQSIGVSSYRLGLFADQELVAWFSPDTRTVRHMNSDGSFTLVEQEYLKLAPDGIVLDRNKVYCIAAVIVDQYGREFVQMDCPISWSGADWTSVGSYTSGPHLEGWSY